MRSMQPGALCLHVSKFKKNVARNIQEFRVRRLTSDGKKAIVHPEICPDGMVQAIELCDLIFWDEKSGFWVPAQRNAAL